MKWFVLLSPCFCALTIGYMQPSWVTHAVAAMFVGQVVRSRLVSTASITKRTQPVCGACATLQLHQENHCARCGNAFKKPSFEASKSLRWLQLASFFPAIIGGVCTLMVWGILPAGFQLTHGNLQLFKFFFYTPEYAYGLAWFFSSVRRRLFDGVEPSLIKQLVTDNDLGRITMRQEVSVTGECQPASISITRSVYGKRVVPKKTNDHAFLLLADRLVQLDVEKLVHLYTWERWTPDLTRQPEQLLIHTQNNLLLSASHPLALLHAIIVRTCCRDGTGTATIEDLLAELADKPWVIPALAHCGDSNWNETGQRGVALCARFIEEAITSAPVPTPEPPRLASAKLALPAMRAMN